MAIDANKAGAAIFLDKDGTLIEDVPFNVDPKQIVLVRGALPALRRLANVGFQSVVISNQSGVARGFFEEDALGGVFSRISDLLKPAGLALAGFYWCPHHPSGVVSRYALACGCRKPEPGMVSRAAHELNLDLRRSWFVGDILDDIECGNRAGCRSVLLDRGHETEWRLSPWRRPHAVVSHWEEVAAWILAHHRYEDERGGGGLQDEGMDHGA